MNNSDLIKAVNNVLTSLFSSKFDGKVLYDISIETNDDTGTEYFMVDVIIDDKEYWKYYDNGPYNSPSDLDDELGGEIKKFLKYAGVNKSFIQVFIMEGVEPEKSIKEENVQKIKMNIIITENQLSTLIDGNVPKGSLNQMFGKFFEDFTVTNNDGYVH